MLANNHKKNTVTSKLYNQTSFYSALANDMLKAKEEIIIYSPFVSKHRADTFLRLMHKLKDTNINVFIFTRPLREYAPGQRSEITDILGQYEETGATIYYLSGYIHEKVAIIDREILWEGSLNILSQRSSREMMRRITDKDSTVEVIRHLRLSDMLAEGLSAKHNQVGRAFSRTARPRRRSILRTIVLCWLSVMVIWWLFIALLDIIPLKVVMQWVEILTANTPH